MDTMTLVSFTMQIDTKIDVAKMMEKNVIRPDLVIFLQADTDTLMDNIARRGREFEKNM